GQRRGAEVERIGAATWRRRKLSTDLDRLVDEIGLAIGVDRDLESVSAGTRYITMRRREACSNGGIVAEIPLERVRCAAKVIIEGPDRHRQGLARIAVSAVFGAM